MTPDYAKAKEAAERVFYILDRVPPIDVYSKEGKKPVTKPKSQRINSYMHISLNFNSYMHISLIKFQFLYGYKPNFQFLYACKTIF
jgi:hypothetical protein